MIAESDVFAFIAAVLASVDAADFEDDKFISRLSARNLYPASVARRKYASRRCRRYSLNGAMLHMAVIFLLTFLVVVFIKKKAATTYIFFFIIIIIISREYVRTPLSRLACGSLHYEKARQV